MNLSDQINFSYHLDLLIVAIALIICSVLGLPWFVAATVLSITHVNSLKRFEGATAPGESPDFAGVYEQLGFKNESKYIKKSQNISSWQGYFLKPSNSVSPAF